MDAYDRGLTPDLPELATVGCGDANRYRFVLTNFVNHVLEASCCSENGSTRSHIVCTGLHILREHSRSRSE